MKRPINRPLSGGACNHRVYGASAMIVLNGGDGADEAVGDQGNYTLSGDRDSDRLLVGRHDDLLDGNVGKT